MYASGKDPAEQECAESLKGSGKQQSQDSGQGPGKINYLCESLNKYCSVRMLIFFFKVNTAFARKVVLIWEQLIFGSQTSARHPGKRNTIINKVGIAAFI